MKFLVTHHVKYEVETDNSTNAEALVKGCIKQGLDSHEVSYGKAKIHGYYWQVEVINEETIFPGQETQ